MTKESLTEETLTQPPAINPSPTQKEIVYYNPQNDQIPGGQETSFKYHKPRIPTNKDNKKTFIGSDLIVVKAGLNILTVEEIAFLKKQKANFQDVLEVIPRSDKFKNSPENPTLECYDLPQITLILGRFCSTHQDTIALFKYLLKNVNSAKLITLGENRIKKVSELYKTVEDRPKIVSTIMGELYGQTSGVMSL